MDFSTTTTISPVLNVDKRDRDGLTIREIVTYNVERSAHARACARAYRALGATATMQVVVRTEAARLNGFGDRCANCSAVDLWFAQRSPYNREGHKAERLHKIVCRSALECSNSATCQRQL